VRTAGPRSVWRLAWLVALALAGRAAAAERPAVLILHSYHPGFTWTDREQRGIEEGFLRAGIDVALDVEYLDAKRHPDPVVRAKLRELLAAKYAGTRFRVVVTTDNAALEFALEVRPELFPGAAVVFCGFNGAPERVVAGQPGVTGVLERWDPAGTLRAIARMEPEVHRLLVVHDRTESGLGTRADLERVAPEFSDRFTFEELPAEPLEATEGRLGALPDGWAVLLMGYNVDAAGKVLDSAATGPLLARASRVPVYTMDETRFAGGVVGGSLLSGVRQGAVAAELAARILAGTPPEALPIVRDPVAVLRFDHAALERFRVPAARLPAGAEVIGVPPSYVRSHPRQALALGVFVLALIGLAVGLAVNVLHRRRVEEALRSSEESLRTTLDAIGDGVIAVGRARSVTRVNPAALAMTGRTLESARGRPLSEVFPVAGPDGRPIEDLVDDALGGLPAGPPEVATLEASDGARREVAFGAAPIRDGGGAVVGAVLVFRDVTAERALQEQLRQAQRMEVVGQLAGGVAHDFNNILTAILGTAYLLVERAEGEDRALAEELIAAAMRARDLTRQLLAFSRKGAMEIRPVEIHRIVEETIQLLSRSIDKRIEIRRELAARPDTVLGDAALLQSAMLNLAVNARDAMPDGGVLTFATEVIRGPGGKQGGPGSEIISITVRDTGVGMDEAVRARLFEPYFTTKPAGRGTGLGLASVYGCVRSHRGQIAVESAPGEGSTFRMLLPLHRGAEAGPEATSEGVVRGHGRIVVVDDEELVRGAVARMLESLGYTVEAFGDGAAAVERFRRAPAEVELVLLDMVMPQLDGAAVFRLLREIDPGVRVVLVSGYTQPHLTEQLLGQGARAFVHKPFRLDEISRVVHAALASPRAAAGA
jgi:two-component system cell cycle sensor histidine kinase/response regulator CckA